MSLSPRWPPPVPDPSSPTRSPLPNLSVLGIGLAFDPGASHLDPFFDPHCAMSRRDIEQDLLVVPFAAVPELMSFDLRRVFKALPLDEQVLRSFALDSFPEPRAAIVMLRGREVMMRRTEAVVFDLGLPRPQDSSILAWMPDGHIIGTEPMPL